MGLPLVITSNQRITVFVIICGLLWVVEAVAPLYSYQSGRVRRSVPNLVLAALTFLVSMLFGIGAAAVVAWGRQNGWGLLHPFDLPLGAHLVLGILALDASAYLAHVLLHKTSVGWALHQVHHSEPEVDVTTALRQHPGETVWRVTFQLATTIALGVPLWVVGVYLTLSIGNSALEHANVRLPETVDRVLRLVMVTPNMHKVHHSRAQLESDSNYSNLLSVWDRLFGTYTARVDFDGLSYGLDSTDAGAARSLGALLAAPLKRPPAHDRPE